MTQRMKWVEQPKEENVGSKSLGLCSRNRSSPVTRALLEDLNRWKDTNTQRTAVHAHSTQNGPVFEMKINPRSNPGVAALVSHRACEPPRIATTQCSFS